VRVRYIPAKITFAAVSLLALLPAPAQELPPNQFLPKITERKRYAEIICSATIVKTSPAGNPITLQGTERSQLTAVANVDHAFKGTLDQKSIEFKYYGYIPPSGTAEDVGPPIANFRSGIRYILFLRRHDSDLEVSIPAYQMEIQIAPSILSNRQSEADPDTALANELVYAIESAPTTIGRSATRYFDWTEELTGEKAVPRVEPFLRSDDPLVRYQAAWWLSFHKLDAVVVHELQKTSQDQNIEEWARLGARDRLRDIAAGRYVP
jgi:hypothetical protein